MGRRILITGLASPYASQLAARLQTDENVDYVGGVDLAQPTLPLGETEFIRADLRSPTIVKVLESTKVDTIVHTAICERPQTVGGRARMKELNVIGSLQLLGSAQKVPTIKRLIVRSSGVVYGSHYQDPAVVQEDAGPPRQRVSGYTQDVIDVEGYVRGFARRRPDVTVSVLRFAATLSPTADSNIARLLSMPVVPTLLGYDPRLQVVHGDDVIGAPHHAVHHDVSGSFNIAGEGVMYLSQAAKVLGRPAVPIMPSNQSIALPMFTALTSLDLTADQIAVLKYGRVMDLTRMRDVLQFHPTMTLAQTLQDLLESGRVTPLVSHNTVRQIEQRVGDRVMAFIGGLR